MRAALLGHGAVAGVLLEHAADAGAKVVKNDGYHPMLFACLMGQREMVQLSPHLPPSRAIAPDLPPISP